MKTLTSLLTAVLLAGCGQAPIPQPQPSQVSWEADIQAFERADREAQPDTGAVLFIGSSSIRLWESMSDDFPATRVLNRGFGGSQLEDLVRYADRIVLPYRPRLVFVYAGDNDVNAGKTPERVLMDYQALVRRIHQRLPETEIAFISIKPSPSRWHLAPAVRAANELVREFSAQDPRLGYVDVFTPMLGPDGEPREELFLEDELHMNRAGYAIWKAAVAPHLLEQP